MLKEIIEKTKKDFRKSLVIGTKIFLKKKKTKRANMLYKKKRYFKR